MNKAEIEKYAQLARLGCILCRQNEVKNIDDSPVEIHHIRRFGQTRNNSEAIPLCMWHHRLGNHSVHNLGHKGFAKYWGMSEEDLLEKTKELLELRKEN